MNYEWIGTVRAEAITEAKGLGPKVIVTCTHREARYLIENFKVDAVCLDKAEKYLRGRDVSVVFTTRCVQALLSRLAVRHLTVQGGDLLGAPRC